MRNLLLEDHLLVLNLFVLKKKVFILLKVNLIPGPGEYTVNSNKSLGNYAISNMKSVNPTSFPKK